MATEDTRGEAACPPNPAGGRESTLAPELQRHLNAIGQRLAWLQWSHVVTSNALAWSRLDPDTLHALPEYRRVAEVAALLRTSRVEGIPFARIGSEVTAGYSIGIGDDVSWDLAVAQRGVALVPYDHEGRFAPRREPFPTDDDRPNVAQRPDLFLGWTFSSDRRALPACDAGDSGRTE